MKDDKWSECYTYLSAAGACFHLKEPLVLDDGGKFVMCWECGAQFKLRDTDTRGKVVFKKPISQDVWI